MFPKNGVSKNGVSDTVPSETVRSETETYAETPHGDHETERPDFLPAACDYEFTVSFSKLEPLLTASQNDTLTWGEDWEGYYDAYLHVDSFYYGWVHSSGCRFIVGNIGDSIYEIPDSNALIASLEDAWVPLSNGYVELGEWMLYGEYEGLRTPLLYEEPDTTATSHPFDAIQIFKDYRVRILAFKGDWAYVVISYPTDVIEGWVPDFFLCSHPLTTCN